MSSRIPNAESTGPWYNIRAAFICDLYLALTDRGIDGVFTKTEMLRRFGRGRGVVLDALAELLRQGALVAHTGVKGGRLRTWYGLPNPMDTSRFDGYVRVGAEDGLQIAHGGWGRDRDGAFRFETHSESLGDVPDTLSTPPDPDWPSEEG